MGLLAGLEAVLPGLDYQFPSMVDLLVISKE